MQISKSFMAVLCCVLLFLTVPGKVDAASPAGYTVTYTAESGSIPPSQSTEPDTFDPFHMLEESESGQQESGPFGTMPDMKLMLDAVQIIGDTPLDELDADQLSRLEQIGVDRATLDENAELISEMIAALSDSDTADFGNREEDHKTIFALAAVLGIVFATFCAIAVRHYSRKRI